MFKLRCERSISLQTDQQSKQLRIFSTFSEKLSLVVISRWLDRQSPSTLSFLFCQLKSFSEFSFSFLRAQEPIQKASVDLLFNLRPLTFSKLSKTLRASESDFLELPRILMLCREHIGLVLSQYP